MTARLRTKECGGSLLTRRRRLLSVANVLLTLLIRASCRHGEESDPVRLLSTFEISFIIRLLGWGLHILGSAVRVGLDALTRVVHTNEPQQKPCSAHRMGEVLTWKTRLVGKWKCVFCFIVGMEWIHAGHLVAKQRKVKTREGYERGRCFKMESANAGQVSLEGTKLSGQSRRWATRTRSSYLPIFHV